MNARNGKKERPQGDLNPCRRLESAFGELFYCFRLIRME
jgi:hypothetical protein